MNTDPKALLLNAHDKTQHALTLMHCLPDDSIKLNQAENIQRQLSDALLSMNALIRKIRKQPEPPVGEQPENGEGK